MYNLDRPINRTNFRYDPDADNFFIRYLSSYLAANDGNLARFRFDWSTGTWTGGYEQMRHFCRHYDAHLTVEAHAAFVARFGEIPQTDWAKVVATRPEDDCLAEEAWHAAERQRVEEAYERKQAEAKALQLAPLAGASPEDIAAAYEAVAVVASKDPDRARRLNDIGFSQVDTKRGHQLAKRRPARRTPEDDADALRFAWRYRRQVPADIVHRLREVAA